MIHWWIALLYVLMFDVLVWSKSQKSPGVRQTFPAKSTSISYGKNQSPSKAKIQQKHLKNKNKVFYTLRAFLLVENNTAVDS